MANFVVTARLSRPKSSNSCGQHREHMVPLIDSSARLHEVHPTPHRYSKQRSLFDEAEAIPAKREHEQEAAHQDLLVSGENVTEIPEDTSVGSTVVRLRDSLVATSMVSSADDDNGTCWSVNITTGDDWGRFGVRAEDWAVVVAAPLDYRLQSRYNLTVELTNTDNKNVLYVTLVILIIDVSGYPPFYNKQCETPVLFDKDRNGQYTVFSSEGFYTTIDGEIVASYDDYLQYPAPRDNTANLDLKGDCSAKFVISLSRLSGDYIIFSSVLHSPPHRGRVEFVCRDRKRKSKGGITLLDTTLDNDLRCPEGWYGVYCDKNCVCKNGARCHGFNGACKCRPGWRGRACDVPWPEVAISETSGDSDVKQVCDCEYGGTCDRWEGCLCPAGRRGDRCQHECAPGTFGRNCSMRCYCENNALCDPGNGSCICAEGQSGEFCQNVFIPKKTQVVAVVLASVIPTIVIIGCIVVGVLVKRVSPRKRGPEQPTGNLEMTSVIETLSSWEVDKEDVHLEHMIGEGEFGHVVRARLHVPELGYEVLVAAKSIRPDRITASAARDFRREMHILARIHEDKEGHPNVVKLYGVLTKSEPQYILVEYASNEELRRYLWTLREQCKITGDRKLLKRLGFACDVACGLLELARLKIVHRDIAARNVVISDRKVAKIADFGLARDVYVSSAYERTEQGGEEELLPLKWMAVESLRDGVYTCESDVWSYGVLLWEIASFGEEPRYAGGPMHPDVCTLLELLKKGVRLQQPQNCPLPVYRIIRSCWVFNPSRRPTADELLQQINLLRPNRHAAHPENHNMPLVPTTRDANSQSQLRLRNAHHLHIPRSRTNTYKNSFFLYTARVCGTIYPVKSQGPPHVSRPNADVIPTEAVKLVLEWTDHLTITAL
ncbi:Endothelial cell-specific molecule 1 [Branchiostoma belcheri]|nr:Endothelial cell-specific molecule 1 [Branchiostoma belcheri]